MILLGFIERKIADFKRSRGSRKISTIILVVLIIIAQIVSILSTVVIFNTIEIISGTSIPSGYVKVNFDYTQPEDMEVSIPYYINNPGISKLTDINLIVTLHANYTHNSTKLDIKREIFYKRVYIGDCRAGKALNGTNEGGFSDYNISAIEIFLNEADPLEFFWILADIILSAKYFGSLIDIKIIETDLIFI